MVEVGRWYRALAVAPAVSMEYWRALCKRFAQRLEAEESEQAVPLYLASGAVDEAVAGEAAGVVPRADAAEVAPAHKVRHERVAVVGIHEAEDGESEDAARAQQAQQVACERAKQRQP